MGVPTPELSADQRLEVARWIEAERAKLPVAVQIFLTIHYAYLTAGGTSLAKTLEAAVKELRRALRITPSSEKRRPSGAPLAQLLALEPIVAKTEEELLEAELVRSQTLARWHRKLRTDHDRRARRIQDRLARMIAGKTNLRATETPPIEELEPLDPHEPTPEEIAQEDAAAAQIVEHLTAGNGPDPAFTSVNETLMPAGAVLLREAHVSLPAPIHEGLAADTQIVRRLREQRVRYEFSITTTRLVLDLEKTVVQDATGARRVLSPSTSEYGPPRYSVTWSALATLTVLVGQFALPLNRLGTLISNPRKTFSGGGLGRMLHYVAERFAPIYLELARQLANADVLSGDDTSCRVIEVTKYFADNAGAETKKPPPWAHHRNPTAAEASLRLAAAARDERMNRREDGDRGAIRTSAETPSLGVRIARKLGFEFARKSDDSAKESMHVSVVSGRSVASDPRSLIVFYRSHLGSCGNLVTALLRQRDPRLRRIVLQGDMSTTNLVTAPDLLERFDVLTTGCIAHARRPFAIHRDEDVELCEYMLHLFLGLALHEQHLDRVGRNRENVLAIRGHESRELWVDILKLAHLMAEKWSKATKLGTAARYIIKHYVALTAYLDDPRLEPTNNLRERMLRMEKLIEGGSMFRRTLEGRFALDIVRTMLQTAVAAAVPVHEYLETVLRTSEDEIDADPARFTPRAWAETQSRDPSRATPPR